MVALKEISKKECEDRLSQNPESFIFSRLADCYRKRGDIQRAIEVCSQGLSNHPDSITGRVILGRCYLEQEKYKEAAAEFVKVIEHDRRNQVALKMLADVYTHQGMTEKAGDIYSFLLTTDPENQSIVNLSANFSGSGATNIYRILGFSEPPQPGSIPTTESGGARESDILTANEQPLQAIDPFRDTAEQAFAQTIQMDPEELKREASEQASDPFIMPGPGGGEAEELGAAARQEGSGVEDIVGDLYTGENAAVTGDDISARMSMMFKEENAAPEVAQETAEQPSQFDNQIFTDTPPASAEQAEEAAAPQSVAAEPSGSDISDRIEQLFGEGSLEETETPAQSSAVDSAQMFDSSAPHPEQSSFQESILTTETAQEELVSMQEAPEGQSDVSGEDIVTRMSEIFEKTDDAVQQVSPRAEEETLSPEKVDSPLSERNEVPDDSGFVLKSGFSETPEMLAQDAVSGDDIAERLETIFEEEESAPSIDASPSSLEENTAPPDTLVSEPSISDTITLDDAMVTQGEPLASEATVVQDGENDEIVPLMEPTPSVAQTASETDEVIHAGSEVRSPSDDSALLKEYLQEDNLDGSVDDVVASEDNPSMSGDDVRSRLDEIFPESLIPEEPLTMVEEIPEGDKDDEKPNEGFYTMSGDDALTKTAEEPLLKQLGDVELDFPSDGKGASDALPLDQAQPNRVETQSAGLQETAIPDDSPFVQELSETDRLNSIPDHVLTPTLADIYFQQGQPQLAIQIYSRLLEKDPDNEKMAKRLQTIKSFITESSQTQTAIPARLEDQGQSGLKKREKNSSSSKGERKKPSAIPKPLAGVHIKKRKK
jgi:tetratricopeptide (TPR) repeat protein